MALLTGPDRTTRTAASVKVEAQPQQTADDTTPSLRRQVVP